MDRLTGSQKHALRLGFAGLLLVVLGLKVMLQGSFIPQPSLSLDNQPAILFFTLDEPCECMQELVQQADGQIAGWSASRQAAISIHRIDFDTRHDLAGQYEVFRVPCLIMLNSQGQIVHRQDYPLAADGPFDLAAFEAQLEALQ